MTIAAMVVAGSAHRRARTLTFWHLVRTCYLPVFAY